MTRRQILWTADAAAAATKGRVTAPFTASGLSIDSRSLNEGDLFIALDGPNFNGHDFIADAFERGAAAAIVDHQPDNIRADAPLIIVADTLAALQGLGGAGRDRTRARIAAVTGSVGKTGTKEALRLVLADQGRTSANLGSLNNHWGLPLSLARMAADTQFGVFEMGMNHAGEITPLSVMARPHVALITTVEPVHSAYFTSIDDIADAKAEIFAGMESGIAVLNLDNTQFDRLAAAASDRGLTILGFGADNAADIHLVRSHLDGDGSDIVANVGGEILRYRVGAPGHHWVANSLAVLATVLALGGNVACAARGLASVRPPDGRGRRHRIAVDGGTIEIIDESYNASPVSMAAALEVLGRTRPEAGGRRIAVLGDMLELGDDAPARHRGLIDPIDAASVDIVFTAGPMMEHLWDGLRADARGGHAADSDTLAALVGTAVHAGDVVMVKGSAGSRMGTVIAALRGLEINDRAAPRRAANGE